MQTVGLELALTIRIHEAQGAKGQIASRPDILLELLIVIPILECSLTPQSRCVAAVTKQTQLSKH